MNRLVLLFPLLLLIGCSKPAEEPPTTSPVAEDLSALCCAQCLDAASKDPQARDLSLVPCSDYVGQIVNGQQVVDGTCGRWFGQEPRLVQDCR